VDLALDDELGATAREVEALGGHSIALAADIAELSCHEMLLDAAGAALGALHCLVNNAGVSALRRGDLLDVTAESYDRCLDINTRGTFFLTQAFAKRLLNQPHQGGAHRSIVTITSVNALAASISRGEYCVSKAGASMVSKLFAARLGNHGIGVYEVQPGIIETAMTAPAQAHYDARSRVRQRRPPLGQRAGGGPGRRHFGARRPAFYRWPDDYCRRRVANAKILGLRDAFRAVGLLRTQNRAPPAVDPLE
jgi:NAD(P)-dependent dehydrogenase (short-subunit alcohol dehydrogenase family)